MWVGCLCVLTLFATATVTQAATTIISTPTTQLVGTGRNDNDHGVVVQTTGSIEVGEGNAISVGSGVLARGTLNIFSLVSNNANRGGGLYGTGPNTIEVGSNYYIQIGAGAKVLALGNQSNGEAINVHGGGNTMLIGPGATVYSKTGAAIWFQDESTVGGTNKVDNYGVVQAGGDYNTNTGYNVNRNVLGTSGGNGINFINRAGAQVLGSLYFAHGDDTLTFYEGSFVAGNIDGGGGHNDLILNTTTAMGYDVLAGAVKNFTTLTKDGPGTWEISGSLTGFTEATVKGGTLRLTGNNDGYAGTLLIESGATVEARAQSLPTNNPTTGNVGNVTNNGTLRFTQDDAGTYVGQIVGSGGVEKTGVGVTNLAPEAGANTYTGGTTIQEGILGISADAALGATSGNVTIDGGTLRFNADLGMDTRQVVMGTSGGSIDTREFTGTISQGISGMGDLTKLGSGVLALDGLNTYTGDTFVYAGTLRVNNTAAGNMPGNVYVDPLGRLEGIGSIKGSVDNSGVVAPGQGGAATGVLTIQGNLAGQQGGVVEINSVLGDDNSQTSKLVIKGNTYNINPDGVRVVNHGGSGAMTNQGIKIIEVDGTSANQAFHLNADFHTKDGTAAVVGGAYVYTMHQGTPDGSNAKDWYLRTLVNDPGGTGNPGKPIINPATPIYDIYPAVLSEFTFLTNSTLMQRVSQQSWEGDSTQYAPVEGDAAYASLADGYLDGFRRRIERKGVWLRADGSTGVISGYSRAIGDKRYGFDMGRVQLGFNYPVFTTAGGSSLVLGGSAYIGHAKAKIVTDSGDGKIKSDAWGLSATATWYAQNGFYADAVGSFTWYDTDIQSSVLNASRQVRSNDGTGYLVSLEVGKIFDLGCGWALTPQAQLTYTNTDFDSFRDAQGTDVSLASADNLIGRLGLGLNRERVFTAANGSRRRIEVFGLVDYHYDFRNESEVKVGGVRYSSDGPRNWGGVSVGGTYEWADGRYAVYAETGVRTTFKDFGDTRVFSGDVGFRINF